jgi:hypothetical protein
MQNVSDTFAPLATYLRSVGRKALLSETGGGNVQSCVTDICSQLAYLRANNDVFLGYSMSLRSEVIRTLTSLQLAGLRVASIVGPECQAF